MSRNNNMSTASKIFDEEKTKENSYIGLYVGGRNTRGERNGRGWAILPNGDQYDGEYRKGYRHGIGLYVFKDGSRYFGQYRCGLRSGRGIFIYPDGSYYEGVWRKNLKHGKGRYTYSNGDSYSGSWYRDQRHGVGIYTIKYLLSNVRCNYSYIGTWCQGIRLGPFQLYFGNEDRSVILHGNWNNSYPQGHSVFSLQSQFLLIGYFQFQKQNNFEEKNSDLNKTECKEQNMLLNKPYLWYAKDIYTYNVSLLPQEPVPVPKSDSNISLSTTATEISVEKKYAHIEEDAVVLREEGGLEYFPYEVSSSGVELTSQIFPPFGDSCAIEIFEQKNI